MKRYFPFFGIFLFLFFVSCTYRSREYEAFYSHLQTFQSSYQMMEEEDYFLVILVDACHLDYTDASRFFQSVAIHPNGSQRGDVGHAWVYLQGKCKGGHVFALEGGHSGEKEEPPARYFDGIMNYLEWGYANPTFEQMRHPSYEPSPIQYLWTKREDGFFQKGSGGHIPTFAAKISLSEEQFNQILSFIRPSSYCYRDYALIGPQCCTFVAQVAALVGLSLETEMTMAVAPFTYYGRTKIRLWEDPCYSSITFPSPDVLEKSLMKAVENGLAEDALSWYLSRNR